MKQPSVPVIGLQRNERFSPNSVAKDLDILKSVMERLHGTIIRESDFRWPATGGKPMLILNMGRLPETLAALKAAEKDEAVVLNPAEGVEACRRSNLVSVMRYLDIPQPPEEGDHGYWLKRGDAAAQSRDDVVFCRDRKELKQQQEAFRKRGITDMVVQAHVEGDLVKFYGVAGQRFFRTYYPADDGLSKFGDEERNGKARHYYYDRVELCHQAERLAKAVATPVYGGDAIIREDSSFVIIDFNDWPSFSRCRDEAAWAIAQRAESDYFLAWLASDNEDLLPLYDSSDMSDTPDLSEDSEPALSKNETK